MLRVSVAPLPSIPTTRPPTHPTKHRWLCQARKSLAGRSATFSGSLILRPCSAKYSSPLSKSLLSRLLTSTRYSGATVR